MHWRCKRQPIATKYCCQKYENWKRWTDTPSYRLAHLKIILISCFQVALASNGVRLRRPRNSHPPELPRRCSSVCIDHSTSPSEVPLPTKWVKTKSPCIDFSSTDSFRSQTKIVPLYWARDISRSIIMIICWASVGNLLTVPNNCMILSFLERERAWATNYSEAWCSFQITQSGRAKCLLPLAWARLRLDPIWCPQRRVWPRVVARIHLG